MGKRVFTCHDQERVWEDVYLRVLMRRGYGKACIYVSYAWEDVILRVMVRRGYGKACIYVS